MRLLDWLFVPKRWKYVCIAAGGIDFGVGTLDLIDRDNSGWIQIVGCIAWGYFALREHEKMTK
jgi:hypothetical protein